MSAPAVANEFAKMRRLRVAPVMIVMVVGVVALSCVELTAPTFFDSVDDPAGQPWQRLLLGLATAAPLASPILIAVLASRQVDIEHQGNGWLFSTTAGLPAGRLSRTKFVATGIVLVCATLVQSALVAGIGALAGITVAFPVAQWSVYTVSLVVVNLVLLALHLLLSARVENQLVGLGVGVLGVFVGVVSSGMPRWIAHLTPWGYYSLATPVDYRGEQLVATAPSHPGIVALAVVGTAVFVLVTRRLDRQEV